MDHYNSLMATLRFDKLRVDGENLKELRGLKQEIFDQRLYDLNLGKPNPLIIDAGSHVGLATIFFKTKWPNCQIIAIEPHPENIKYFRHNLWQNHLDSQINLIEKALDTKIGERPLYFDDSPDQWYSTSGFIKGAWNHTQTSNSIMVPTITLDSLISEPIDLLKMDIEGAEVSVLTASAQSLPQIRHLVVECHQLTPSRKNTLIHLFKPSHRLTFQSLSKDLTLLTASLL